MQLMILIFRNKLVIVEAFLVQADLRTAWSSIKILGDCVIYVSVDLFFSRYLSQLHNGVTPMP